MGDDGDRRSLLWSPAEILSDSEEEEKQHDGQKSDSVANLWTPDSSLLVPDDRLRRSSLWGSAVTTTSSTSREETRAGKQVAEIQVDREMESRGLLEGNGMHDIEQPATRGEIKEWVRRTDQRRSMAERFSEFLRPQPDAGTPTADSDNARERRRFSDPGRGVLDKRVSQLNVRPSLQRRNSLAMQVSERVPPEWVLLLLGCLLGLASGISVVLFNKGVCMSLYNSDSRRGYYEHSNLSLHWHLR